jgi:hypothetical protein
VFRSVVKYGIEPNPAGISKFKRESDLVLLMLMEVSELLNHCQSWPLTRDI